MTPADLLTLVKATVPTADVPIMMALAERESGLHDHNDTLTGFDEHAFLNDRNGGSYGLWQMDFPTACDRGYPFADPAQLYEPDIALEYAYRQLLWIRARPGVVGDAVIAAWNEGVGNARRGIRDETYVAYVKARMLRWELQLSVVPDTKSA